MAEENITELTRVRDKLNTLKQDFQIKFRSADNGTIIAYSNELNISEIGKDKHEAANKFLVAFNDVRAELLSAELILK